jgi:hypothetical protein
MSTGKQPPAAAASTRRRRPRRATRPAPRAAASTRASRSARSPRSNDGAGPSQPQRKKASGVFIDGRVVVEERSVKQIQYEITRTVTSEKNGTHQKPCPPHTNTRTIEEMEKRFSENATVLQKFPPPIYFPRPHHSVHERLPPPAESGGTLHAHNMLRRFIYRWRQRPKPKAKKQKRG